MKFEYRKFGDMYHVSELHSYDSVNKVYKSEYVGTVKKTGKEWIGSTLKGDTVTAKTREKASIAMVEQLERGGISMDIKEMNIEEQTKWASEQQSNGKTYAELAKLLDVNKDTLRSRVNTYRKENGIVITSKNKKEDVKQISTKENEIVQLFTEEEINVLKTLIREHLNDVKFFHEYRIYAELEKVPRDMEPVRSAFNMSKETTERLKKFASVRRIPLQDLVELAVMNLLNEYDK